MPFIKLNYTDIQCLIEALEEVFEKDRTEQENKTLGKLKVIAEMQRQAHAMKKPE